ncbi:MAG: DUF2723 domain-containing protein [Myxococcales bacterium]|nr:DUF2723 domain-containing protein [Myxococcales bacterium]
MAGVTPEPAGRAAGVFAVAGAFFAWAAMPAVHWHDTAEFAAVARRLSLSHSPGHPLHALTTHGVQQALPLGDAAFRANLASGLCLALACAALYRVARAVAPGLPWLGAAALALVPALLPGIWLQGVRAEVYALQLALSVALGGGLLAVARGDGRALPAVALGFGLAGANHSLIGAALLPAALLAMAAGVRRLRPVLGAVPAGALGLATYAYVVLRATAGGEVGWGRPTDLAGLWATVSAQEWAKNATSADVDLAENTGRLALYLAQQYGTAALGLLALLLAFGALPALRLNRAAFLGALAVAAGMFGTRFFYTFDPLNPDLSGYFAAGVVALLVAGWAALAALVQALERPALRGLAAALPAALLLTSVPGYDPGGRQGARRAGSYGRGLLDEAPVGGALVTSDYSSTFLAWALRALEGARPDVAIVFRGQVNRPWFAARLATQAPRWAARLPDFPAGLGTPAARFEPGVEGHRLGPLLPRLGPAGLTLALGGAAVAPPEAAWAPFDAPAGADLDTRRAVALHHVEHAMHLLDRGLPPEQPLAAWHLQRAEALAGPDPMIADLAARLGPQGLQPSGR